MIGRREGGSTRLAGGAALGDFACARRLSAASHNSLRSDRCSAAEAAQAKSSQPRKARRPRTAALSAGYSRRVEDEVVCVTGWFTGEGFPGWRK